MLRAAAMVVLGLSVCGAARAASFDCKAAKTDIERAICSDKDLSAADETMAATYKQVMAEAPAEVQTEIREDQRTWVRSLATVCKADAVAKEHTAARRAELVECLKEQYKNQTAALQQRVFKKGGVVFVMRSVTLKTKDSADNQVDPTLETNPGYGTVTVTWPQALSESAEWAAWNKGMLLEAQRMTSPDGKTSGVWNSAWAADTDSDVTGSVDRVSGDLVSVSIANDMMGHGAAHPNESYEEFNWLLKEQRRLRASDVFAAGSGWEKLIDAKCRASLKAQVGDDYDSYAVSKADFAKTLHDVIVDPANWTLDAKGLTISFPEYSVTPRVEPVDPVEVPWSELKSVMAKGFVTPQ